MTEICYERRRNFGDQRKDVHKELCTLLVDFLYSEAVIVRIDEVCLEIGEFYGL